MSHFLLIKSECKLPAKVTGSEISDYIRSPGMSAACSDGQTTGLRIFGQNPCVTNSNNVAS